MSTTSTYCGDCNDIPHSDERIFSLINKNKTSSRSSLRLDATLSALVIVKTHIENPVSRHKSDLSILGNAGCRVISNCPSQCVECIDVQVFGG